MVSSTVSCLHRLSGRYFSLPTVTLGLLGLWEILAGLITFIPIKAMDRLNKQFIPIASWFMNGFSAPEKDFVATQNVHHLAWTFKIIIGTAELAIGCIFLGALIFRSARYHLARIGLTLNTLLFGSFMFVMFWMHDKNLPAWNQYPAILAWTALTWLLIHQDSHLANEKTK